MKDMEQATLMWKLRVKIDSWSQGIDESIRHRNRLLLTDLYLQLPPRRVWLYVKQIRMAYSTPTAGLNDHLTHSNAMQQPEDVIARGEYAYLGVSNKY